METTISPPAASRPRPPAKAPARSFRAHSHWLAPRLAGEAADELPYDADGSSWREEVLAFQNGEVGTHLLVRIAKPFRVEAPTQAKTVGLLVTRR